MIKRYLKYAILFVFIITLFGCGNTNKYNYIEKENDKGEKIFMVNGDSYVETDEVTNLIKIDVRDMGIIIAELYPEIAPITVKNFQDLVSEKFYDGLMFHRVIKDFMIQTGDPTASGMGGSDKKIKGEFSENGVDNDLSHTRGVLSMARAGSVPETEQTMNSASSQFFIVHKDSPSLNGKYAAFGKVVHGIEIVDKVAELETDDYDKPLNKQRMNSIRFVKEIEK